MSTPLFDTVWELPRAMRAAVQSQFYLQADCIDSRSPWTQEGTPFDPFVQLFVADITPAVAGGAARPPAPRARRQTKSAGATGRAL
jgi:hypothetical protein